MYNHPANHGLCDVTEPALVGAVRTLLHVCGTAKRVGDLYSDKTLTSRFTNLAKQHLKVRAQARCAWKQCNNVCVDY